MSAPCAINSRDFSSIPRSIASASVRPCASAYLRTSSVIFMLQKCGSCFFSRCRRHTSSYGNWSSDVCSSDLVLSFVCSIGNVPLAAVLWKGGISFGGVIAFIFADLIILPILAIYRKYYGTRMAVFLFCTFYAAMAGAGYVIEILFGGLGLIPERSTAHIAEPGISWNYTTWLNIV